MGKGTHLLIDCLNVPDHVCHDDESMLNAMARAATRAGAKVISQSRYHFGHNSPPGFAALIMLDESHCSAHCYAEENQIALDVFTCGGTDPWRVLEFIREEIDLGDVFAKEMERFPLRASHSPVIGARTPKASRSVFAEVANA